MPKSYAQNLLFGFNQLHPEPPDLSIHAPSSFTLPGANFSDMPEPIPSTAASVSQASPDSFAATHTLSNAAFSPIASIPGQSPQQTRLSGLAAYVTQDLDPTAPLTSTHIFGSTPPFLNDHNSNMAVGRAVASSYGYTGDPALFLREKGRELGFTFPSDLANEFQLYAHIGESFSQSQRAHAQKRNTQIQARRPSDEEIEKYLPKALMKAVSGSPLNWLESSLLKRAGVQESSLRKVRYILQNGKLPGFHSGWRKSLNSRFNDLEINELAQAVKDDPVARYILCELARKEGYNSRSQAHDNDGIKRFGKAQIEAFHNLKEPMVHAIKQVGSGIATAVDNILDGDVSLAMQDDNFIFSTTDEAEERNRRAFYHDFTSAFNAGYQQRTDELKNNLKDSWSFNVSQFLSSSGNVLGQTLPYFNGATALMAIGGMASDEMNKAASNALHNGSLYSASGWELYGAPSTKAAIFGASIAATGAMFSKGAALISNTAIGRYAADRIALSPLAGYASRFAEGAASEAVEELSNALGQEAFELTGLVQDHQKESHMSQFVETMTSPDFWGANIGMNLGFAAFGLHGSRSKAPYKALKDLKKLGFSTKEAWNIGLSVRQAARNGASPAAVSNIVADAIRVKQAAAPQEMQANLQAAAQSLLNQQLIEQAAASGVRDFLVKEANISDMQKTPEGKIKAKILTHNGAGEFEAVEQEFSDSELNDYLLANLDSAITQEILNTQKLVRGEQLVQAADTLHSQQKSPFARIATMLDAPAELLAQLKGKDTFDEHSLALFAQYALNNVQSGSFGNIPVPASSVASVAADFSHRIRIARDKGEIAPDAAAESTAFIIPGKTPGDNVLMLARGQVSAKSLAHDWLEGFARSRYDADPDFWQATLDAVDRELLQNKVTQKSIFSKPEGQREHLDYIEAFSNLAESSWLANHDVLNVNDTAHALADEMLEDLGSVQAGIALAQELSRYLESDAAKQAIGQGLDPLRDILTQAGASLTDLVQEAENQSPQTAADFILQHRQRIQQELADLASQADAADSAPPVTQMESNAELQSTNITDTFFPDATPDSPPITVKDVAQLNGVDPALGTLSAPPPAAYASVTSPDGAGKGLNGGIAHRMRDGSIEGAAPVASLSLHKSLSHVNLSRAQGDTTAPVICHRSKDGSLHVIGGFARLVHEQLLGIPNTHVKVYPSSKKFDHRWATDRAAQEAIRAGIASTRDTLKYFIKHKLTRTQARKRNLIPSDAAGQELPSSRAAWLLLRHSPAKTVAQVSTGKLSLHDALSSIAAQEPAKSYSANAKELASTASFSIQAKKGKRRYSSLADMVKNEQFFTLLDEAKRIERQAINFVNPEKELDSLLVQSSKLNGLLNAISQLLPKDARPWKTLPYIRERFQAFAGMAVNPHLPFNPNNQHAKAFTADEITRYNELDPKQRREFISRKLEYAYKSLTKSTARSLEAYLSRELMDSVERAIKTLQPKLQPSGKEKRGLTSASTFKKAMSFYNMMNMAPAEVSLRQLELNGILTNSDTSEQEIDNAERELKALALFGNLREASLEQTQNAVNVFMEFLETGKEAWEYKLAQERQAAEKIRTSLSKVQPRVKPSAVNAAQQRKQAGLTNLHAAGLDSFMNATQTLYALSAIPGDFGKTMKNTLEDLALAQDNCTAAINSYKQKADALLDAVLNIQDLPAIIRDAKRSAFLVDANQYKHPNIHREGTIRIHNYKFSKAQIDALLDLQKTATTQELAEAIERHRTSSNVDQDLRFSSSLAPRALRALNDAVTQTKEEHYQGGTVYVQIYGKRDADHIEKLDLTPLQAANLVLMAEQASYDNKYDEEGNLIERGTMDINGYTPKVLYQLENYAGAKLMTWLRNLRELFNTTGLFEAYEEYTGLPFPREENYWPGVFESPKQGSMTDALDSAKNGAGTYQMLIKRRDHITPPDSSIPATAAWESAITQHFTYIHLSPITRELRRITRNKDFQTRLAQIATPQLTDNLVQLLDTIDGAPSVCLRAIKPLNRTFALTVGKHAANVLAGATASGFKNLTGILNGTAYQGINGFNLIPYTIKGFTHQHHITPAQLLKLPVFQNRLHRDSLTNDAAHLSPGDKQTALSFSRLFGMRFFMEYPDLIANLTSMTAVYNHQFDTQLQALHQEYGKNYTPTQEDLAAIRQTCEKTVSSIMHMAAQPMEQNDKSAFLHTQNWAQNMTTYMKGEILIKIGLARAQYLHTRLQAPNATGAAKTRNRLHAVWNFYSTLAKYSLAGQAAAVILTIASNGAPEDEDEFQNWLLTNTLAGLCGFGLISLIPIIGDTAAMVMQSIFGERGTFATYSTAGVGGLHPRNIRSIRKLIDPEQSEDISTGERWLALSDTSRFLGTTIGAFGGSSRPATIAAELFTGLSALLNIARPYFQHLKNTAEKDAAADREYQKHLRRQRAILRKLLKARSYP